MALYIRESQPEPHVGAVLKDLSPIFEMRLYATFGAYSSANSPNCSDRDRDAFSTETTARGEQYRH